MRLTIVSMLAAALIAPTQSPVYAQEVDLSNQLADHAINIQPNQNQISFDGIVVTNEGDQIRLSSENGLSLRVVASESQDTITFDLVPGNVQTSVRLESMDLESIPDQKMELAKGRHVIKTQYFIGRSRMRSLKNGELTGPMVQAIMAAAGISAGGVAGGAIASFLSSWIGSKINAHNARIERWIEDRTNKGIKYVTYANNRHERPISWKAEITRIKCPKDRRTRQYKLCQGS